METTESTAAAYSRRARDKRRGGPPREPQPCGTRAAAKRHRRNGEPLDDLCATAERDYAREYAQQRSARAAG